MKNQNIKDSIRFPMFETGVTEFPYATHGGTIFLVNLDNIVYALTARHIAAEGKPEEFDWKELVVTNKKFGDMVSGIKNMYKLSKFKGHAIGSDIGDIIIFELSEKPGFFHDTAFIVSEGTFVQSKMGDDVVIFGALKEKSRIEEEIKPVYCELQMKDAGTYGADLVLRRAIAKFDNPEVDDVTGISGAPVLNLKENKLSGMVLRAGIIDSFCQLYYLDIFDIMQILLGIKSDNLDISYKKSVLKKID